MARPADTMRAVTQKRRHLDVGTPPIEHTFMPPIGSAGPNRPKISNRVDGPQRSGEATILHADLDAFYAAVEQRDDPRLRSRPVIVGHGVVLAASYEAKACGVRTAMSGTQARRLCPAAVVVEPRMSAYTAASKAVFALFEAVTPRVEGLSIDEAFLDVGGLRQIAGAPSDIAVRLRRDVAEEVGLPITVGVAPTKFLAKVASAVAKPDGLLVVPAGTELAFLHPLPIERLWGVGRVTAARLRRRGITTVGQLATAGEATLTRMLGRATARHLDALAHGRDPRRVDTGRRRRSIGSQRALGPAPKSEETLDALVIGLVDRLARRLRGGRRVCRTVVLRLRFADFSRATRSRTMAQATADTAELLDTARGLLTATRMVIRHRGLTLLGLSLANLSDDRAVQLALPVAPSVGLADRSSRPGALDAALDAVRERYGSTAVTRAVLLGHDPGPSVPLLPD
jgi:DNA polymerase-4